MNKLRRVRIAVMKSLTTLLLALMLLSPASAASLPSHYPETFTWVGEVQSIRLSEQKIVVEDRELNVGTVISVHRLRNSRTGSLADLSMGMIVGCKFGQSGQLLSIWELPDDYAEKSGTRAAR